jgi:type IV pilus assembly protein PilM
MSNKLFFKDKPVVGIDISQTSIKIMSLDTKHWTVTSYGSIDLDPAKASKALEGDPIYLADNITTLLKEKCFGKIPSDHVVLSVPSSKTYSRTFSLPTKNLKHIQDAISLEVEQYIPVPLNQLYLDYQILGQTKESASIQICAVPRILADACIAAAQTANLRVVLVEPGVNAIARLLSFTEDGTLPTVIVDIGPAITDIAILVNEVVQVSGSVSVGGNTFTLDIAKELKIPLENAHQLKVQHGLNVSPRQAKIQAALEPSLKQIVAEIRKVVRYYTERISSDIKIEQLIVVGGGSNIPGLGDYFTNSLMMPARVASPWQILNFGNLEEPARQFKSRYITVAGLASVNPEEIFA